MCARCWPTSPPAAPWAAAPPPPPPASASRRSLCRPRRSTAVQSYKSRRRAPPKGAGRMERMRGGGMKWMQTLRALAAGLARNPGQLVSALGFGLCVAAGVWMWRAGLLSSRAALQEFLAPFGPWAAALFVAFQAVQVVVPVLPGGLGCLAGVVLFGPFWGFLYNYMGICLGSFARSALPRSCGRPLLYKMFPAALVEKYDRWSTRARPLCALVCAADLPACRAGRLPLLFWPGPPPCAGAPTSPSSCCASRLPSPCTAWA